MNDLIQERSNRSNLALWILVAVLIVLAVWLGMRIGNTPKEPAYWAVTLTNGEVYFGKLSWWPKPRLRNAWVLQRGVDAEGRPQAQVLPVTRALWNPVSDIHLNPSQIISWSRLAPGSDLIRAMENPDSFAPQNNQPGGLQTEPPFSE
jgi:hypothetical protein